MNYRGDLEEGKERFRPEQHKQQRQKAEALSCDVVNETEEEKKRGQEVRQEGLVRLGSFEGVSRLLLAPFRLRHWPQLSRRSCTICETVQTATK